MKNTRLEYLFTRYHNKIITSEEREDFMTLLLSEENQDEINRLIENLIRNDISNESMPDGSANRILNDIFEAVSKSETGSDQRQISSIKNERSFFKPWWVKGLVAASLCLLLVYGKYLWYHSSKQDYAQLTLPNAKYNYDVLPGDNKAKLTLSNGTMLDLSKVRNGHLMGQPTTKLNKENGEIIYTAGRNALEKMEYNTLTTPMGGQYKIVLSDGSRAWLNAGSCLKFPTYFSGSSREVMMSGEIYFEIEPNKKMPFHVKFLNKKPKDKGMEIIVLGTHFNICSYADEAVIQTTLLEGSVEVKKGTIKKILTPGQQAQVADNREDKFIKIETVDTESVVAWKEGRFEFNGNIKDIMRQISRWYNLEIQYEGNVGNKSFAGAISRKNKVSEVLKMLELTGEIQFNIEEGKIIVREVN